MKNNVFLKSLPFFIWFLFCLGCQTPKEKVLNVYEKHIELIEQVQGIHASSKNDDEYRQKIKDENIREKYEELVKETRFVMSENRKLLSEEDKEEIKRMEKKVNELYDTIWWKGIRF